MAWPLNCGRYRLDAGFPRFTPVGKTKVWRILNEQNLKSHRIRYYLEKRDPDFDRKMKEVLLIYREVALYITGTAQKTQTPIYTVSKWLGPFFDISGHLKARPQGADPQRHCRI